MKRRQRVLILTADAGFGHRSAAKAIEEAILDGHGDECDCKIVNPVDDLRTPGIIRRPQLNYDRTIRSSRGVYYLSYRMSDSLPISTVVEGVISRLMAPVFRDLLLKERPDAIISTYLLYNSALRSALKAHRMHTPFLSVITDLADVHHMWFQPGPDMFFTASDEVREEAIRSRVSPARVAVSGLPVDIRIPKEEREKDEIRRSLGWDPSLPTVLAVASKRVKGFVDKLEGVEGCGHPMQLVVVAGGNDALYQEVNAREWKAPIHTYNFVGNLPEMMLAADVLVTKAGGLIVSEGLACGLPMILIDSISGQETGNVRYVCNHGVGVKAKTREDVRNVLCEWLGNEGNVLRQYAANARLLGKPGAAYRISDEIWKVLQRNERKAPAWVVQWPAGLA